MPGSGNIGSACQSERRRHGSEELAKRTAVDMFMNAISVIMPFDAAQTIIVEDFELCPVLLMKRPHLTVIKQNGLHYCPVDPTLGFTGCVPS